MDCAGATALAPLILPLFSESPWKVRLILLAVIILPVAIGVGLAMRAETLVFE